MASKIHTDNPKHHKYVVVNKRERKKEQRRVHPRLSLLVRAFEFVRIEGWCDKNFHYHFRRNYNIKPYHLKGTLIVWDDCNHQTYRVLKKRKFGTFHFVNQYYGWLPKHFKRSSYYGYV